MFERFTERARMVVVLSQDAARALKHSHIRTEHILLGLLAEQDGLAAHVLRSLGFTFEQVREQTVAIVGEGDEALRGQIPFTPAAKKVLELALREALSLGTKYIGTEHLLLGLLRETERETDGVAVSILGDVATDVELIRDRITKDLADPEFATRFGSPVSSRPSLDELRARASFAPLPPLNSALRLSVQAFSDRLATTVPEAVPEFENLIGAASQTLTVYESLRAIRIVKEAAIQQQDFPRAAALRDIERTLSQLVRRVDEAQEDAGSAE